MEIDRRSNLSREEFFGEYALRRLPVVIIDALESWRALSWTPESIKSRIGPRELTFRGADRYYKFDDLIDLLLSGTQEKPAPYARNFNLERDLPELYADVQPRVAYANPDWKSSRLLPKDWLFPNGLVELFIGGPGTKYHNLHIDYFGMDGFLAQIYGEKQVILFSPEQTPYLYPEIDEPQTSSIADVDMPDLERFPLFAMATPASVLLKPGDLLYIPNGWWHTTRMHVMSITAITATWNSANWRLLISYIYRYRFSSNPVRTAATVSYLKLLGGLLWLWERTPFRRQY